MSCLYWIEADTHSWGKDSSSNARSKDFPNFILGYELGIDGLDKVREMNITAKAFVCLVRQKQEVVEGWCAIIELRLVCSGRKLPYINKE